MSSEITARPMDMPSDMPVESSTELLRIVWRRKLIVLLIASTGIGLGYLYFLQQVPIFSSSAQVLIIKDRAKLPIEGLELSSSYDRTHETLIRSPLVIQQAVSVSPEIATLPSLRGLSNPASQIIGGLRVSGDGGKTGDILKLDYESAARDDCPIILGAVVKAYQRFLGDTMKKQGKETTELIGNAKDELEKQIKELKEKYAFFQKKSPLLTTGETSQNLHQARLQKIEEVRSEAVLVISQLQAQVEAIETALKRGGSREALNLMVGKLSQTADSPTNANNPRMTIEEKIFPLMLQEQELIEKFNYGPDHPQVKMIKKNIEMTRKLLLGREEGEPTDFYAVYLSSLRETIQLKEQTVRALSELFDKEQQESRALASVQIDDENYRSEIIRKERIFDAVVKRLEEISLIQDTGGARLELIHPPTAAGQIRPDMTKVLAIAGILGVLAGVGLAYLIDSADRRFKSPDEIRNDFGLPVFGHIPVISEAIEKKKSRKGAKDVIEAGSLARSLSVHHQSKGRVAEAYRGVRTSLFFSTRISGHKVFQVTSPSPGDGKTTLVGNLAISLANAGKKVLLIDADFRRPRIHHLFGVVCDSGMSSVIAGTVEVSDAIRETAIENLSVLPCGPRPSNPAELLTSKRFEELLELLREKYEFVLIDSPPVLAVTDPLNVAPRVDGVLLVIRLTKTARHNGRRALEAIEAVGANILGVVVNGVGKTPGYGYGYGYGYSYGGYSYGRYGYGKTYSYNSRYGSDSRYGESYGETSDKVYYTDSDDDNGSPIVEPATKHRNNGNGKN